MRAALTHHWPEYLMEAAGLGIFMLAACTFATLLEHPASSVRQAISDPILRRLLMGLAMGLTAISLIYRIFPPLFSDICFQINWLSCFRRYGVSM